MPTYAQRIKYTTVQLIQEYHATIKKREASLLEDRKSKQKTRKQSV
jgi:hypothetical protein